MRVLVTTFPGYGHFHPVAPLALALRRAGHDVRVATDPRFGRWVKACGLPVLDAGLSGEEVLRRTEDLPPAERAIQQFTTVSVPPMTRDVLAASERWRPEAVINEEGEHAGPLLASLLGIPCTTHSWPAPARPPDERAARLQALAAVWRELGAPGAPQLYGERYLDCCPPPLQGPAIDAIPGVATVRPTLFDGPPSPTTDPVLDDLRPPVVFVTLGTVALFARPEVLQLLAGALATVAGTLLVATGPHPSDAVRAGGTVRTARYLPLSAALPVSDLVVSHGGASTAAACVLSGVPHLVVPQGAPSQQRTASAVAASGLGAAIEGPMLEEAAVAAAADALLTDPTVRDRVDAVRSTLDALPDPDEVADSYFRSP